MAGPDPWPWQAVLAVASLALTTLAGWGRGFFKLFSHADDSSFRMHERGWAEAAEAREEARLLRIALSRAHRRDAAKSTALEICALAMPLPLEDRIRAMRQAREVLERSLNGSGHGSGK